MQLKLILLDFDGTLVDTRRANTLAYLATMHEAGYRLSEEEYATRYFGMRCAEFLTEYGIADADEREQLRRRKIELYPTFFDSVRMNEPLWEFCRAFQASGGKVWIVSTGSRDNILNVMRHVGIGLPHSSDAEAPRGRIDGMITGADIKNPKPAPDCFLKAMQLNNCTAAESLIFEDSAVGLAAARNSGAPYIRVEL